MSRPSLHIIIILIPRKDLSPPFSRLRSKQIKILRIDFSYSIDLKRSLTPCSAGATSSDCLVSAVAAHLCCSKCYWGHQLRPLSRTHRAPWGPHPLCYWWSCSGRQSAPSCSFAIAAATGSAASSLGSGLTSDHAMEPSSGYSCSGTAEVVSVAPARGLPYHLFLVTRMVLLYWERNKINGEKLFNLRKLDTYILSRFKCISLSVSRIFGVWLKRSSRNSVKMRAALLYFSLELPTLSCIAKYSC